MLVLTRKVGESLVLGDGTTGAETTVTVHRIQGNRVTLAINAPSGVRIVRAEIVDLRSDVSPAMRSERPRHTSQRSPSTST